MHWLREKLHIFRIRFMRRMRKLHVWGRHRMSLMLIPHSERIIFKLSLNNYLLVFLFLTCIGIGFLTAWPSAEAENQKRLEELIGQRNEQPALELSLRLQLQLARQSLETLGDLSEKLNDFVWPELDAATRRSYRQLLKGIHNDAASLPIRLQSMQAEDLGELTDRIRSLTQRIAQVFFLFKNAGGLLKARLEIMNGMPIGRPLRGGIGYTTSDFGWREDPLAFTTSKLRFHGAIDLATKRGTPILSTGNGEVTYAQTDPIGHPLGKHIRIKHAYGFETIYGHCDDIYVNVGDKVKPGQLIGTIGMTGLTSGPHVHYAIHIGSKAMNPNPYLNPLSEAEYMERP